MANEAVLYEEYELPSSFTVADGAGIEKGTVLKLADPNTASAADGTNDVVAGIAAQEKIANNGQTKLAVYRRGVFKMYASGSIAVGDPVGTIASYANYVASNAATANLSGSKVLGFAKETASNGETLLVELNIGHGV